MQGSKRLLSGTKSRGTYELRVELGTDPLTGKRRQLSRTHHGGVGTANAALRDLIKEVEEGQHRGANASVSRLLADWLDHIEGTHSPTTVHEYRRLVSVTINPVIGTVSLKKLDAHKIDRLYRSLTDRGLSPGSVRQVHAILRSACRQGVRWGWLSANPVVDATPPKVRQQQKAIPTPAEVQKMIRTAEKDDPDMAALIALAAVTGARRGELLGLRWGDIDWADQTLTIERSLAVISRGNLLIKGTKTHQIRRLALDPFGLEVLVRHKAAMDDRAADAGVALTNESPIFSYDLTHPINPDVATNYVRAIATKCEVDCHLHSLRHFAATMMVGDGTDVRTVSGRLGHASPALTLNIYSHWQPERDRAAAESLGKSLTPAKPGTKPDPKEHR